MKKVKKKESTSVILIISAKYGFSVFSGDVSIIFTLPLIIIFGILFIITLRDFNKTLKRRKK